MFFVILFFSFAANAKGLRFALVAKGTNSPFFQYSREGCLGAAKVLKDVECIFTGPKLADVRKQDQIINELVEDGVDGIAVAVTKSDFLAKSSVKKAREMGIPVVTFDADFSAEDLRLNSDLRFAYVGTDNYKLGVGLGDELKVLKPEGGTICLQSGRVESPNLDLRLMGVRSSLSESEYSKPPGQKLNGENGWIEHSRCPLYSWENIDVAFRQMKHMVESGDVDVFVAVGGWAQNSKEYGPFFKKVKRLLDKKEILIVMGDTNGSQMKLLSEGLSHVNVGQKPYEMGRKAMHLLKAIIEKSTFKEINYTPLAHCNQENHKSCNLE